MNQFFNLKILKEIKSDLDVNSFGSEEGYNGMLKMMIDNCISLGDMEKAEQLKKEIIK